MEIPDSALHFCPVSASSGCPAAIRNTVHSPPLCALVAKRLLEKEGPVQLGISMITIDSRKQNAYRKLGIHNRTELRALFSLAARFD